MIVTHDRPHAPQLPTASVPGRLLVVDDNLDYLRTLELLLENSELECRFCSDGPSAIEQARQQEFDVLLTDVRMAPLDGVETARAIKSLQPLLAVIMMTGFDKEDTPIEALRLGAVDYIDKPITNANAFLKLLTQHAQLVRSDKRFRLTKERLEAVVAQVDAGVVVLDAEGRVEHINEMARALAAPGNDDLAGAVFREVCHMPELLLPVPQDETASKTFERHSGGERRLYQVSATRLPGLLGRPGGMVLLVKDLTALAESQKAEGWRQMSRAITHGMKTPLATLRMRVERLRGKPECADISGEFGMLLQVIEELHSRLRDMVDLVKLDISPSLADINQSVARALRHFESHRRGSTRIEYRPHAGALMAPHSSAALELAIENLLSNSQESRAEDALIEIATARDDEHDHAVIEVTDNGPGIPPELRDELFRRPLNSTKPGGSGLGAALVKYIVDQHHGRLSWQSPLQPQGEGTRVTLQIPLSPSTPESRSDVS